MNISNKLRKALLKRSIQSLRYNPATEDIAAALMTKTQAYQARIRNLETVTRAQDRHAARIGEILGRVR